MVSEHQTRVMHGATSGSRRARRCSRNVLPGRVRNPDNRRHAWRAHLGLRIAVPPHDSLQPTADLRARAERGYSRATHTRESRR